MYYILKEGRIIKCFAGYRVQKGLDRGMRSPPGNGYKKEVGRWDEPTVPELLWDFLDFFGFCVRGG